MKNAGLAALMDLVAGHSFGGGNAIIKCYDATKYLRTAETMLK
jgi:hypothetical protein